MDNNDNAFQKRLLATFKVEAGEHAQALSSSLIELETAAGTGRQAPIIETIFRESHSLKGAARAVGKREVESLCQALEGVFSQLKSNAIPLAPPLMDLLDEAVDTLDHLLVAVDSELPGALKRSVTDLGRRLKAATLPVDEGEKIAEYFSPQSAVQESEQDIDFQTERAAKAHDETVRIAVARLDSILFRAEALLSAKLGAGQRAAELIEVQAAFAALHRKRMQVVPQARTLQHLMDRVQPGGTRRSDPMVRRLLGYLAWEESFAKTFEARLGRLVKNAEQGERALSGMADGLLADVKKALMMPVASTVEALPRFVRDFARSQGKEVEFSISGGETEIDRRILEEIRDPLLHLVRNSLDHGIEFPEVRLAAGKPRGGRIDVVVNPIEGGRIEIVIIDDGAGIDPAKVRASAERLGLASDIDDPEATLDLIFESGLSTSALVTDISGRGLGLAIVREKVERLGGTVRVSSTPGMGTKFRIILPLTLATFRGVHVRVGDHEFIFPTAQLERVLRVGEGDVWTAENREVVSVDGQVLLLARLADVLELDRRPVAGGVGKATLVIAGSGEQRIAFLVDALLGEQEVLVKGLGRQLARVRNIAGATVLGNGRTVLILHLPDLLQSARLLLVRGLPVQAPVESEDAKQILVAEDSITSRQLIKGILESAGYQVSTAVDGVDAYAKLRAEPFNLLVSDVEMPGMSGFELTALVRADKALAELPVVLLTALDSRDDRQRGADVGANAYLVKNRFDRSNLIETVRRLL